jgi:hypothetical protein
VGPRYKFDAKFGVRHLGLAFIERGSARPTSRAVRARPGKPGHNKAAASRRTPSEEKKKLIATLPDYKSVLNPLQTLNIHFSNRNKKTLSEIIASGYSQLRKNRNHRKLFKTNEGDQF